MRSKAPESANPEDAVKKVELVVRGRCIGLNLRVFMVVMAAALVSVGVVMRGVGGC